jgi:hypothetical protein
MISGVNMAKISEAEKKALPVSAKSASLREDMRYLMEHRHNPVLVDGVVDMDRLIHFLTGFNEFIDHEPKPFKPMIDRDIKL